MEQDNGRVPDGTGLSQAEPASRLGPSGFDPSRDLMPLREAVHFTQARVIGTKIAQRCVKNETTARYARIYQAALWGAAEAMRQVPADVARLVIAARMVAFEDADDEAIRELAAASEEFASRVPWEDEPCDSDSDPEGEDAPQSAAECGASQSGRSDSEGIAR